MSVDYGDVDVRNLLRHRAAIERAVGGSLGRTWRIGAVNDLADRASHPAAVLSDGEFAVFAKLGRGGRALDQFERERESLAALTRLAGVRTPEVIGGLEIDGGVIHLHRAVTEIDPGPEDRRRYGEALARLHAVGASLFGSDGHCYWGDLRHDNEPLPDWPEFFWRRRVEPQLRGALASGHLPAALAREVGNLESRFDALCGPEVTPSLLHGDAHQNNVLATPKGPVFIDPALYYGHPEVDLATVDYFTPVAPELFRGYEDLAPIDAGFAERRELWRLPFHLVMIEFEGEKHIDRLRSALSLYS